jgi:hypothetical protein
MAAHEPQPPVKAQRGVRLVVDFAVGRILGPKADAEAPAQDERGDNGAAPRNADGA